MDHLHHEQYVIQEGLSVRRLGSETIVIDPKANQLHTLRDVGARIWDMIEAGRSVSEMAEAISREFDAPADLVRSDLDAFLAALRSKGLIETPSTR